MPEELQEALENRYYFATLVLVAENQSIQELGVRIFLIDLIGKLAPGDGHKNQPAPLVSIFAFSFKF